MPSSRGFPTQGSNPGLPHCRWILYHLSHWGSPRILGWVAYPFSRGTSWPRNPTRISSITYWLQIPISLASLVGHFLIALPPGLCPVSALNACCRPDVLRASRGQIPQCPEAKLPPVCSGGGSGAPSQPLTKQQDFLEHRPLASVFTHSPRVIFTRILEGVSHHFM